MQFLAQINYHHLICISSGAAFDIFESHFSAEDQSPRKNARSNWINVSQRIQWTAH